MQVMVVDDDSDKPKAIGSVTKKPRAARTKVDPSKSIALKNMLNWIRDKLNDGLETNSMMLQEELYQL
jgi:hypothetical protein